MKEIIDNGNDFDWGRASENYAKYRDIYPKSMYEKLNKLGVGIKNSECLDIGTGTGVLPRNMYSFGAHFTGIDIADNQILMAKELSKGMNIDYVTGNADILTFESESFDSISAVQCWRYFDKEKIVPELYRVLKPNGILAIVYMQWLPLEDEITDMSLKLVKKYNPCWGAVNTRIPVENSDFYLNGFEKYKFISYDEKIPFTYDSWNGRMRACRGIDATLSSQKSEEFLKEHLNILKSITNNNFEILHQIAIFTFKKI